MQFLVSDKVFLSSQRPPPSLASVFYPTVSSDVFHLLCLHRCKRANNRIILLVKLFRATHCVLSLGEWMLVAVCDSWMLDSIFLMSHPFSWVKWGEWSQQRREAAPGGRSRSAAGRARVLPWLCRERGPQSLTFSFLFCKSASRGACLLDILKVMP